MNSHRFLIGVNGWQNSGGSPVDDHLVTAPDRAADKTLVWSLLVQ